MSFSFISLGCLLALTGVAAVANAQEETDGATPPAERAEIMEERRAEMQETMAERQATMEERRAQMASTSAERQEMMEERRAALQERAQERITNLAANMSNRMDAVIARIQNVITRLESRMEKLEDRGVDTSEAAAALSAAQAELNNANTILATIDEDVAATVGSENPRESWQALRETYTSARDAIKLAHQGVRNTIALLKAAVAEAELERGRSAAVSQNETASSSEEVTEEEEAEEVTN